MEIGAAIRHRVPFSRPSGLKQHQTRHPMLKTLGYYQPVPPGRRHDKSTSSLLSNPHAIREAVSRPKKESLTKAFASVKPLTNERLHLLEPERSHAHALVHCNRLVS